MATFSLSCKGLPLDNAELVASLRRGSVPVANELLVSSASNGNYEVSWTGRHKAAPDGHYVLDVYRKTDQKRVAESKGQVTLEPLFSVELDHNGIVKNEFIISPEILLIALLAGATILSYLAFLKLTK
jgi:hypothetical protein